MSVSGAVGARISILQLVVNRSIRNVTFIGITAYRSG